MVWQGAAVKDKGIDTRSFNLNVDGHLVPGIYWAPAGGADRLVLLGHGGTTHKKVEYIVDMAQRLCAAGVAAMAIDGPGHGERVTERWEHEPDRFNEMWQSEGGTATVLMDWRAALDFVEAEFGPRPTGWWGLSMGTMMGLPVTATEPRIRVAVLGLMGEWGPNAKDLVRYAPQVSCPVRFLVQWDDEIVPRDSCLNLFSMLGTAKKTLHANPGAHQDVPQFEFAASVEYLTRYLR
jgi:alpha-beta hydrolase superfamily lysophospholipase